MGAGMVKVLSPAQNRSIIQTAVPELLYGEVSDLENSLNWADVVVIGPGLGQKDDAVRILHDLLWKGQHPLIMDADALNLMSKKPEIQELARKYTYPMIFTPHMMELSRLTGVNLKDLKVDLLSIAKKLAKEYHSVVVCKDAVTIVVQEEDVTYLNLTGNNGMATAGSGDVLTGIIGALLGQGENPFEAATKGVYLHGLAGDKARDIYTEYGVTASRLIENIRSMERL
jgi:NAD(P)H-hydrate epimerase